MLSKCHFPWKELYRGITKQAMIVVYVCALILEEINIVCTNKLTDNPYRSIALHVYTILVCEYGCVYGVLTVAGPLGMYGATLDTHTSTFSPSF